MSFAQFFKERRTKIGTVRQFASDHNYDIAYISRLENGVTLPPRDPIKLEKLSSALGIINDSTEWREFMDLAAMAKNELPADLKDNSRAAALLPTFYRVLRNEKLDKNDTIKLIKQIKNSGKE